ncbi:MAG: hypothetical protein EBV59_11645, partial [Synechococcaceae bacterium WB7_1C_051]|nr:hypothetical protein [Synechococcaceae bacterium WB7_1C_051]
TFSEDPALKTVTKANFERNIDQMLFNDNLKERNGLGMWWDGKNLQFGNIPAQLVTDKQPKK